MSIGSVIKARRISLGLTQDQLGKMLGWPDSRIGAYERGEYKPRQENLRKLLAVLAFSSEELEEMYHDI